MIRPGASIVIVLALGLALRLPAPEVVRADAAGGAEKVLADAGLVRSGRTWIVPEEAELRWQLDQLGRQERTIQSAREQFDKLRRQYVEAHRELDEVRTRIEQINSLLASSTLGGLARQNLEGETRKKAEQLKRVVKRLNRDLGSLDAGTPVGDAALELGNAQSAALVSVLAIGRYLGDLDENYAELAGRPEVAAALAVLGPEQALGPMTRYPDAAQRRQIERLSSLAMIDGVPVYRRSGKRRIQLVVAERAPATFTYAGVLGPTVVAASVLESAGIEVEPNAAEVVIELDERKVASRPITIPVLRIGKHVLRDVRAFALPPEEARVGSQLSAEALGKLEADLDERRLWFRVRR